MCSDSRDPIVLEPGQHRGSGLSCISAALEPGGNDPREIGGSRCDLNRCLNVSEGVTRTATTYDPVEPPLGSVVGSSARLVLVPLLQVLRQKRLAPDVSVQFRIIENHHHLRRMCRLERFEQ